MAFYLKPWALRARSSAVLGQAPGLACSLRIFPLLLFSIMQPAYGGGKLLASSGLNQVEGSGGGNVAELLRLLAAKSD